MYKIGDLVVVLDARGNEFIAYVRATPKNDKYDLELAEDEIGLQCDPENSDDIDVFTLDKIVRVVDCYADER